MISLVFDLRCHTHTYMKLASGMFISHESSGQLRSFTEYTIQPGVATKVTKKFRPYDLRVLLCFLSILLLFCPIYMRAQAPKLTGIAHVAFRVSDVNASREFYRKLGFKQAFAFNRQAKPSQAFIKINDTQFIELYAQTNSAQQIGLMHICFEANDLTGLYDAYRKRGLQPTPVKKAAAGNLLFTLQGPEGQTIEFTQYMPGSKHVEDRGKHLGINRISRELIGVSFIMQNMKTAEAFYKDRLHFPAIEHGKSNSLALPENSREGIELESAGRSTQPKIFFRVKDIEKTTEELKRRGISVQSQHGKVYVTGPDGTLIVFVTRFNLIGHP